MPGTRGFGFIILFSLLFYMFEFFLIMRSKSTHNTETLNLFFGFELVSLDMFLEVESPGGIFYNIVECGQLY